MSETVVGRAGEQIAETARTASRMTSAMADALKRVWEERGALRNRPVMRRKSSLTIQPNAWGGIRWKRSSGPSRWASRWASPSEL